MALLAPSILSAAILAEFLAFLLHCSNNVSFACAIKNQPIRFVTIKTHAIIPAKILARILILKFLNTK